jgi:hypothetical protein
VLDFLRREAAGERPGVPRVPWAGLSPRAVEELTREITELGLASTAQMEDAIRTRLAGVPPHAIDAEIAKVMALIPVPDAPANDGVDRQHETDADSGIARHAQVLAAWRDTFGIGQSVGIDTLVDGDIPNGLETALLTVAALDEDRTVVNNIKLGQWLCGSNGVVVDGLFLQHEGSDRGNHCNLLLKSAISLKEIE